MVSDKTKLDGAVLQESIDAVERHPVFYGREVSCQRGSVARQEQASDVRQRAPWRVVTLKTEHYSDHVKQVVLPSTCKTSCQLEYGRHANVDANVFPNTDPLRLWVSLSCVGFSLSKLRGQRWEEQRRRKRTTATCWTSPRSLRNTLPDLQADWCTLGAYVNTRNLFRDIDRTNP